MVSDKIRAVGNKVKAVGKMIATPIVKLKDGVTAGLSKIKSQITGLAKTVSHPVTLGRTVVMAGPSARGRRWSRASAAWKPCSNKTLAW